jgi:hypothetical protein
VTASWGGTARIVLPDTLVGAQQRAQNVEGRAIWREPEGVSEGWNNSSEIAPSVTQRKQV